MAYRDRFTLKIKEFGRVVIIEIPRGKVRLDDKGKKVEVKKVTIFYDDGTRPRKRVSKRK